MATPSDGWKPQSAPFCGFLPLISIMEYRRLVEVYNRLDATSSTLEKTDVLADAFGDAGELLPELTQLARGRLFASWESDDLGVSSSLTMQAVADATGVDDDQIESWWRETGDLGDAAAIAVGNRAQTTLVSDTLDIHTVYETLRGLAEHEGSGSQERRIDDITNLLSDAEPDEARYIVRTIVGAMRLGVGEGTIRDAIAAAFFDGSDEATQAVERAYGVTNDFRIVGETAREQGRDGLETLEVELFRPVKAMLAQKSEGLRTHSTQPTSPSSSTNTTGCGRKSTSATTFVCSPGDSRTSRSSFRISSQPSTKKSPPRAPLSRPR